MKLKSNPVCLSLSVAITTFWFLVLITYTDRNGYGYSMEFQEILQAQTLMEKNGRTRERTTGRDWTDPNQKLECDSDA